jgi:flagellar biosynthetic protein FlhB
MDSQELERNEPATPHKMERAREQGRTGRSADLPAAAAFTAAMLVGAWHGVDAFLGLGTLARQAWSVDPTALDAAGWHRLIASLLSGVVHLAWPGLAVCGAAVLGSLLQGQVVCSPQLLQPDPQRLDPMVGMRRIVSLRAVVEGLRGLLKLAVLLAAGALAWRAWSPELVQAAVLPARGQLVLLVDQTTRLGLCLAAVLLVVAAVDVLWSRRLFLRDMRMSRRELQDEQKQREGDPRVRARLRELRRELLRRARALRNTRDADLVLVNPTHVAVALRYVHGEMPAPVVVSKGAGALALAIRTLAHRHRIQVLASPALARRMFREVPLDQPIPPAFHAEVARLFVWLQALRAQQRGGAPARSGVGA